MVSFDVNTALENLNKSRGVNKAKGDFGEEAVLAVVDKYRKLREHGYIYHSFSYKYASDMHSRNYPGNIKRNEDGTLESIDGSSSTKDEIDILFITSNRIFAIEAKARSGYWKLFDYWCTQSSRTLDKYPVAQAEKHARHLYHQIYAYLPDGNPDYIVPITVFVDKAVIEDSRNERHQKEYPIAILNTLIEVLMEYDKPLDYALDLPKIREKLKQLGEFNEY